MSKQTPLTGPEWRGVYGTIRDRFGLSAKQRDQLDASPLYYRAMAFAKTAIEAHRSGDETAARLAYLEVSKTLFHIFDADKRAEDLGRDLGQPERPLRADRLAFYADHEVWDREFDDPADPITGHVIELERRDPADPNCYPCCGGLKITRSHTSRCRAV